jgi:hypothetical protein
VRRWNQRTEIPARQFVGWLGIGPSKFHDWKDRYGKRNEHNAWVPRDCKLSEAHQRRKEQRDAARLQTIA